MANPISIQCPSCEKRFQLTAKGDLPAQVRLRCAGCRTIFILRRKPAPAPAAPLPPPTPAVSAPSSKRPPGATKPAPTNGVTVLVANESREYCRVVREVIATQTTYAVEETHDGEATWKKLLELRPQVLVTDVALPGLYGFEMAERVRKEPALDGVKVILIASIYDKTRYKRNPTQLYGAHDYVEKHHIPDSLVPKINNLLLGVEGQGAPATREAEGAETEAIETPQINEAQEQALRAVEPTLGPTGEAEAISEEKARRLARIIVSDIALYSEELLDQGLREGNVEELLAREFDEARELYVQRVPGRIRSRSDFLGDEIARLIAAKKAEFAETEGG